MRARPLFDHGTMPLVVEPADDVQASPDALGSWAAEHRHDLDVWLHRDGAVLLRGFGIGSPEEFRAVVAAIRPRLLDYVGGDSPRSNVADQVYTSTEFPPHLEIGLHNELSYTRSWPERIFFCCLVVAKSGGETHIADSRKVLSSLEPAVRGRFSDAGEIPRLLDYVGGDSPRSNVADQVYTSTEFPPHLEIGLHNELSYTRSWPERIFFCCLVVAKSGGETHIADSRKVLSSLEPAVRDRFSEKGVIYKQHLRDDDEPGPGKSWQETFETSDRAEVERICADQDMEFQWAGCCLSRSGFHQRSTVCS